MSAVRINTPAVVATLVVTCVLSLVAVIHFDLAPEQPFCTHDPRACPNGKLVLRTGLSCAMAPCEDDGPRGVGTLYTEVLWNTPLHSWTGVASEAVDFVVPLADRMPNLAVSDATCPAHVCSQTPCRREPNAPLSPQPRAHTNTDTMLARVVAQAFAYARRATHASCMMHIVLWVVVLVTAATVAVVKVATVSE